MTEETKRKWEVDFKMTETDIAPGEDQNTKQREISHTIARAIGSIQPQLEGLQVTDYHIYCEGKEQPEAACLEVVNYTKRRIVSRDNMENVYDVEYDKGTKK